MSLADVGAFLTTNRVPHNQQQTQPFQSSSYIPFEEYAMRAPLTTLRPRFPTPCPTIPNNILVYDILHKETTVEAVIDVPGATDENVTLVWNNNGDPTVTVVRTIRTLNASDYYGRPSGTFSVALPIHQYINVNENPRWQLQNGVLRLVFTKRTTPADPISLRSLVCIDSAEDTSESAPQLNM